jgi:hypothetical protein
MIKMNQRRKAAIVGVLILVAYSMLAGGNPDARVAGMVLEVISGAAVIGIALIVYRPQEYRRLTDDNNWSLIPIL